MIRTLIVAALALLPLSARAQTGPSFDCRQARAWDERQICAQADLAELDRRIAVAWRAATERASAEERTTLQAAQRAWLGERRGCEGPQAREAVSCLRRVMRVRARDLEALAQAAPGTAAALPTAKPAAAAASAPTGLRAVSCPATATAGWAATQICATPGMQAMDAAVIRDAEAARARLARNPAALAELETLLSRYVGAREACVRASGRVPLDCLQETMEDAQAEIRRRGAAG
ncbi:lysozyme inhibitor LprI family protein [Roseomonas sp. CAU 1739]|uniref:lysozyme inhibitor LprI family protein n=1 Tax=Roseomonas sp. CAU 1739 TaxID=3140364 RepID=UPI00325BB0B2